MDISPRHRDRVIEAVTSAADPLLRVSKVDDAAVEDAKNDLREALDDAEILAGDTFAQQQKLWRDEETGELRPEVLKQRSGELEQQFAPAAREVVNRLSGSHVRLAEAIRAAQVPRSASAADALLAREEIKLAVSQAREPEPFDSVTGSRTERTATDVMVRLAQGGGELAAAVASPWGRLILEGEGQGRHHAEVVEAAIAASGGDGAKARSQATKAAEQLPALEVAASAVRSGLAGFGLGYGNLRDGIANLVGA